MDLTQTKLSKLEWGNIEIPVSEKEKRILETITKGFANPNIRFNSNLSLFKVAKIDYSPLIEYHFYVQYFEKIIKNMIKKYAENKSGLQYSPKPKESKFKLKSADMIRLKNVESNIERNKPYIFEFLLVDFCQTILKSVNDKTSTFIFYLYTLIQFRQSSILQINKYVQEFTNIVITYAIDLTNIQTIVYHSFDFIEKNPHLIKYEDLTLFTHQKELFTIFHDSLPKLVLYTAPTGTGKTLSPLGLSQKYRVIFVCVARHVGLALAKSAISAEQKVAFAFGCETASDIRLHNHAASTYTKNYRSGGIGKIDNSVGDKVEIMICDVKSYLTAMYYMLAFNSENNIVTYWDEPTITMDYETHDLHETIHRNWTENKISKMVLSCATLPKEAEIAATINDFEIKFPNSKTYAINSYDCKKTISLLNKCSHPVLPHLMFSTYRDLIKCVDHCSQNKTLLRYFDLNEIIRFIRYAHDTEMIEEDFMIKNYFREIQDITMNSVKTYYLDVLEHIDADKWKNCFIYMTSTQPKKFDFMSTYSGGGNLKKTQSESINPVPTTLVPNTLIRLNSVSTATPQKNIPETLNPLHGILLTTVDAHTLTDGPTIYLVEDVEKIGRFYIEHSKIPDREFKYILEKINENNKIQEKMEILQRNLEDKLGNEMEKEKKMEKETVTKETRGLLDKINLLRSGIQTIDLNPDYIPNRTEHQHIWNPSKQFNPKSFTAKIDEKSIKELMVLPVSDDFKILLLLGIGVFKKDNPIQYLELIKKLAYEQKLFLIIASSDYIYGTNYQFCHGFIGEDLENMTQQKTIQAMGRIGRNNVQQEYTVRFRNDTILERLFMPMEYNLEAINMSNLFCS